MTNPRVLYVVTEPWYFVNHRLDHARALLTAGFDVHVATRRGERWHEADAAGCVMHHVDLDRGAGGPLSLVREARALRQVVRKATPDVVHAVALKPVALAVTLLAMRRGPALILSVNGLGMTAARGGQKVRWIGRLLRAVSRVGRVHLLFQTESDRTAVFGSLAGGEVIPGVGVDVERFVPGHRESARPFEAVYLGRAVVSKGLTDLAAAADLLPGELLHISAYCARDDASPGALTTSDWHRLSSARHLSVVDPTPQPELALGTAHFSVLPSRAGEGVSKFVLESLASGAPVVLASESGSAEVIEEGVTGVLFRAADPASLCEAMTHVADWSEERMDTARRRCRAVALERYSLEAILPQIVELHRRASQGR